MIKSERQMSLAQIGLQAQGSLGRCLRFRQTLPTLVVAEPEEFAMDA